MRLFDRELIDPTVHCFARCYMCKRLVAIKRGEDGNLELAGRECPHCGTQLTSWHLLSTLVDNTLNTQAVTSAQKISGLDPAAIIVIAVGIVGVLTSLPVWFRALPVIVYFGYPVLILRWLYKYWWRIRFTDEGYLDALRHMRLSLCLWVAADILNALFLLI